MDTTWVIPRLSWRLKPCLYTQVHADPDPKTPSCKCNQMWIVMDLSNYCRNFTNSPDKIVLLMWAGAENPASFLAMTEITLLEQNSLPGFWVKL